MIALSMISKGTQDEVEQLDRALVSIRKWVDAAFVTFTQDPCEDIKKVCDKHNARTSQVDATEEITQEGVDFLTEYLKGKPNVTVGEKIFCFDKARNYNFSQIPKEYNWILWMDTDDVFRYPENLKHLTEDGLKKGIEAYYFNYLYHVEYEPDGKITNVIIQHLRERLIRNTGVYRWIAPIHETLIEQRPTKKIDTDLCDVVHLADMGKRMDSLFRNLKVLELSVYQTKGKDPRPVYYLAKAYYDLNKPELDEKAVYLINLYLEGENKSGWPEERNQARDYLADIYRRHKEYDKAIEASTTGLIESPKNPNTYISVALSYMLKGQWDTAMFWTKLAASIPEPKTTLVSNPKDIQGRTLEILYNCCINLGMLDEAWQASMKLVELYPKDQQIYQAFQFAAMVRQERDLTKAVVLLADHLKKTGENGKIKALLTSLPRTIENNPFTINLYQQNFPPKPWEDKEIAIYCGQGFTTWSPKKLDRPGDSFVGGSEEAVCLMSEALAKQGWKVTVYADPGEDEGEISGVQWLPYYKFNRLDNFNILIAWRDVRFFDYDFKAEKKYLWLHDIQNGLEFTPERVSRIDKVFFLSKWHYESNYELKKNLPQEKVFYTTNGIPGEGAGTPFIRNLVRVVHTSSPDRGLEHLVEMWPDVKKEVPEAELHVFYGFQLFDRFYGNNPSSMGWKKKLVDNMAEYGIVDHGRVPQPELKKFMEESGIWAYPTHFGEINCISAIKAQAYGCEPVVVNYAALKETVQFGRKVEGDIYDQETKDEFKKQLIEALKNPMSQADREYMQLKTQDKYSWDTVAKDWSGEFKE